MSIGRQAVRGALWTISSSFGSRGVGLIATLVIARFVSPTDYGEVMIASVLVLTTMQLSTLGVGQYIIANPNAGRGVAFHATLYHLVLGGFAFALLLLLGEQAGELVGARGTLHYLPGLVLAGLVDRVSFMPERILVRDFRFGTVSSARAAGEVAYSVVAVALAATGYGAMAIVIGNVARSALRGVIVVFAAKLRDWFEPCRLSLAKTRELFAFGIPLWLAASSSFASRRWDNLLIARFFGPGVAGMYSLAYNLADVPAIQVGEHIGDVLLPSFSRLPKERRGQALVRAIRLLAIVVFPLAVGLGLVGPTLVRVLFPPDWQPVGPMLLILSLLSITRPVGWTVTSFLQAENAPRTVMVLEVAKVIVLLGAIATIGRLGPLWACTAVGIAFALHMLVGLWALERRGGPSLLSFLRAMAPALSACCIMAVAVVAGRSAFGLALGSAHDSLVLALEIGTGAVAYVLGALVVARDTSRELIARVRGAFGVAQAN